MQASFFFKYKTKYLFYTRLSLKFTETFKLLELQKLLKIATIKRAFGRRSRLLICFVVLLERGIKLYYKLQQ